MWTKKNSLETTYRYAYDVILADKEKIRTDQRYYWERFTNLRNEAYEWCHEHCTSNWSHRYWVFSFDSKSDALMFKMVWAGRL